MEAAGFIEKVSEAKPLYFNFEDVRKLPPPIIAFNDVAFAYSGKMADALYKDLSFGIECVALPSCSPARLLTFCFSVAWTPVSPSSAKTELESPPSSTSSPELSNPSRAPSTATLPLS